MQAPLRFAMVCGINLVVAIRSRERVMNIGDLARAAETKAETIRYYECIGLLPAPPRSAGNYRDYSAEHVSRLVFTRRARDLGFSIDQIRTLLDLADQKEQSCKAVDAIAREHLT